jgi:integrase
MSGRSSHTNALALSGGKWTPHDLRRTAATFMTALGVLPEVAEKCLNHTEESRVKRTCQRYSHESEKREAWRLLGERLDVLIPSCAQ